MDVVIIHGPYCGRLGRLVRFKSFDTLTVALDGTSTAPGPITVDVHRDNVEKRTYLAHDAGKRFEYIGRSKRGQEGVILDHDPAGQMYLCVFDARPEARWEVKRASIAIDEDPPSNDE